MKIQIDETLFRRMYAQLRCAESLYWKADGAINDNDLNEEVTEAYHEVVGLLDDLEPIITSVKKEEGLYA